MIGSNLELSISNILSNIEKLRGDQLNAADWESEKLNFIPLRGSWFANSEADFDLEEEINKFLAPQSTKKIMLLMGNSGAGKSLYTQGLVNKLWQNFTAQSPIPIWISLPSLKDPVNKAIEETFEKYGFNKEQIEELRRTRAFIFILDAYDEIRCETNLYQTNNLNKWNAKIILTCRREYLYYKDNYKLFFAPFIGDKIQYNQYEEIYIKQFNAKQIQTYVNQYIKTQAVNWKKPEKYQKAIEEIAGLKELIKTPFILKLTMEVLPQIVEKYATQNIQDRKKVTQAALYDVFIEQWFVRQEQKLKQAKQIKKEEDIKPEFWAYAKELATEMHKANLTQVVYNANEESDLLSIEVKENIWAKFFAPKNPRIELLRTACLVRETNRNHYSFVHLSMLEYFLTRNLYENITTQMSIIQSNLASNISSVENKQFVTLASSITNNQSNNISKEDYFNQRLIVKESNTLQFLADRIIDHHVFKNSLFEKIYSSRNNSKNKIAAANAITILNRARVIFSGMDLSGVCIPEADLSFAILSSTNLSQVDLRGVNLRQAYLLCSDLTASEMAEVNFGQLPSIANQQESYSICSSTDGCYLAIASKNNVVIQDTKNRKEYKSFSTTSPISCIAYSPSKEFLAIGSRDNTVRLWSVVKQAPEGQPFIGHTRGVRCIAFSPNGEIIASGGQNYEAIVQFWSLKTNSSLCPPLKLDRSTMNVNDIAFSPDGKILAVTDNDAIRLWSLEKQSTIHSLKCSSVHSIAFSPDGKMLVSGSWDKILQLWSMESLSPLGSPMVGHTHYIHSVSFSNDGKLLASGSEDKTVRLWSVQSQTLIGQPMLGHDAPVRAVSFIEEDKIVVSAGADNTLRFWLVEKDMPSINQSIILHTRRVDHITFSVDGKLAAIIESSDYNPVWLWSLETHKPIGKPMEHKGAVACLTFSKDGNYLACGSYDSTVQLWNVKTQESCGLFLKHDAAVKTVAFSDNGKLLVSGSEDASVRLWNVETRQQIGEPLLVDHTHTDKVQSVAISSNGKFLASASENGLIVFWSVEKLTPVFSQATGKMPVHTYVEFSPDGKMMASGNWNKQIQLWTVDPFSLKGDLTVAHCVETIAFSQDGTLLASGGIDNTVRLYDVISLTELNIIYSGVERIHCIRFIKDDAYLEIATENNLAILQSTHASKTHSYSLLWQTGISSLVAKKLNLTAVQNLSENNFQLLKQLGAIDSTYYSNTSSSTPTFYKPAPASKAKGDKIEKKSSNTNNEKDDIDSTKSERCYVM